MNYTDPFVLRDDVLLIPCADLSEDMRGHIAFDEGDVTLSHRYGRSLAQVIDRDTAALLELFRRPRTLVDAVVENSRVLGKDPEAWFEALLPHLGTFVDNRVLVPAGSGEETEIRPRLDSGTIVAGYEVVRCANLLEDSEIVGPAQRAIASGKSARFALRQAVTVQCELLSGLGQAVFEAGRTVLVLAALEYPAFHELAEAVGKDVAGDAEVALHLVEAPDTEERLTEDEERPALAHDVERLGDGTVVGGTRDIGHQDEGSASGLSIATGATDRAGHTAC